MPTMLFLIPLLGVVGLYLLSRSSSGSELASDPARDRSAPSRFVPELNSLGDPVKKAPPQDEPPTDEPPPSDDGGPRLLVLEAGDGRTTPAKMKYCGFEGQVQLLLPAGARWDSPPMEVYYNTGGWTWNMDPDKLSGRDSPVLDTHAAFCAMDLFWIDSAGKQQQTYLLFSGPDKAGETDPDAFTLCDLAHCPSCSGKVPGTRVSGVRAARVLARARSRSLRH